MLTRRTEPPRYWLQSISSVFFVSHLFTNTRTCEKDKRDRDRAHDHKEMKHQWLVLLRLQAAKEAIVLLVITQDAKSWVQNHILRSSRCLAKTTTGSVYSITDCTPSFGLQLHISAASQTLRAHSQIESNTRTRTCGVRKFYGWIHKQSTNLYQAIKCNTFPMSLSDHIYTGIFEMAFPQLVAPGFDEVTCTIVG